MQKVVKLQVVDVLEEGTLELHQSPVAVASEEIMGVMVITVEAIEEAG